MSSIENNQIVWWRDVPIDVEWGLIDYLLDNWKGKIIIVSANGFSVERKNCLWEERKNTQLELIVGDLDNEINHEKINRLVESKSIHLFSGIRGDHHKYLDLVKRTKNNNCILVMESPSLYGKMLSIKKILYPLLYGFYNLKYGKMFKALLVMGDKSKEIYSNYGWNPKKIFEFIYLPRTKKDYASYHQRNSDVIKGLYIGRFDFDTKGLKILMNAIDQINPVNKWEIDFVGGYGKDKDEVINWCEQKENVNFLGSWLSDEVIQNMQNYDFCIAPSLYDGWNMTPLQTINAKIGCIVSDNAGSTALIRNSNAGKIFKAGDSDELKKIIEKAIDDENLIKTWKNNAISFQNSISNDAVGDYFISILKYVLEEGEEPICPWIKKEKI